MSIFIFDEDYEGPRYTYGATLRPIVRFSIPDGWIVDSQKPHPKYRYGTVDYPEPLAEDVAEHYNLYLVEVTNDQPR